MLYNGGTTFLTERRWNPKPNIPSKKGTQLLNPGSMVISAKV